MEFIVFCNWNSKQVLDGPKAVVIDVECKMVNDFSI